MGSKTGIEWTDATWNPILGCSRVSEGCRNCYAEAVAARFRVNKSGKETVYSGLTQIVNGHPQWTGKIVETKQLLRPLSWKKPKRIFVNSMSDLFHENVTDEQIDKIFAVMALCREHTFQVLTKRPERMLKYMTGDLAGYRVALAICELIRSGPDLVSHKANTYSDWLEDLYPGVTGFVRARPLPNVWLGVSVENQATADERIPLLLQTPAAVRFVSAEPLLGPVDLDRGFRVREGVKQDALYGSEGLRWVICGGESGPHARPMHPDWARSLRDQCQTAEVPFFFKQWGEYLPDNQNPKIISMFQDPPASGAIRVGKKASGHLLDGKVHQEFPKGH